MRQKIIQWLTALTHLSYFSKRFLLLGVDAVLIVLALWISFVLRLERFVPPAMEQYSWLFLALPIASFPLFIRLGLYNAVIRYASLDALWVVCKGVYSSFFLLWALVLIAGLKGFPRTVPFIYFFLSFLLIGGSRLIFRYLYARLVDRKSSAKGVLIYGAGSSGAQIATAFRYSQEFTAVAFVDDNKRLHGRRLHGVDISPPAKLPELVSRLQPQFLLLAMPSASRKRTREILTQLEPLPVEIKMLPPLDRLVSGQIGVEQIRDVSIEDLLGRDPVPPKMELLRACVTGKSVLVTGAGGSIGSELCRQIANQKPKRLVLFERSELALYAIEQELRNTWQGKLEIVPILGSVCRRRRVTAVLKALAVDTIYHAAAYKHVPMVEYNPIEGVRNNLFGTLRTAQAAMAARVETFVLISTDKAVRPTNVMGASKRMAELVLQAFADQAETRTRFTMVRFGNVLGSSGSVVPLFRKQVAAGGPVTVTHPDINRYFMTIPEAVQLVLQAGSMGKGGDVFVLDMGEPVRIVDLAEKMIRLSGLTVRSEKHPEGDISIAFTGLRPGEKLYEELLVGDNVVGTNHPMIMRAEERFLEWTRLNHLLDSLNRACRNFAYESVRALLLEAVDGYKPQCDWVDPIWLACQRDEALRKDLQVKAPLKTATKVLPLRA